MFEVVGVATLSVSRAALRTRVRGPTARHPPLMHSVSSRAGPLSPSIRSDLASCPRARPPVPSRGTPSPPAIARGLAVDPHPAPRRAPRDAPDHILLRVPTLTMTSSAAAAAAAAASSPSASSDDALFLGLDFGTSGARAVVVDASGDVRHESVAKSPPIVDGGKGGDGIPDGGWAEAWRGALWTLLDRVPSEVSSRVAAVAVDGTSGTVLMVDGATGEPIYPPMLYNEKRPDAMPAVEAMAPEGHTVRSATSALCKLHSWWTEQASASATSGAKLLHHADWIAFLLHGEMGVTDHNNALKLGFDPAGEGSYPSWLSGAPYASTLPARVLPPGTRAGTVASAEARSRLPEGCVVVAGTTDSVAAFVAARCTSPGDCVTSLGSSLALKMVSEPRVDYLAGGCTVIACAAIGSSAARPTRRMASPLVLHRRRTRDAHRADGRRANGLGRRSRLFPGRSHGVRAHRRGSLRGAPAETR